MTPPAAGSGPVQPVTIGLREIYDELVALRGQVSRLADQQEGVRAAVADHEARLRSLEKSRWPLPSAALLVSIAALVAGFVKVR